MRSIALYASFRKECKYQSFFGSIYIIIEYKRIFISPTNNIDVTERQRDSMTDPEIELVFHVERVRNSHYAVGNTAGALQVHNLPHVVPFSP